MDRSEHHSFNPDSRNKSFADFSRLLVEFVEGRLQLSEIQRMMGGAVKVESNANSWVSHTIRRPGKTFEISIGEQKVPDDIIRQWGWGADTVESQYLVKISHEYAHVFQDVFDQNLVRWLDGADDIPEDHVNYILLYAFLAQSGRITGLSDMNIYHEQSKSSGNLSIPVYEDMAEMLGAYFISEEYFNFRVGQSRIDLSPAKQAELKDLIVKVVQAWKKLKA